MTVEERVAVVSDSESGIVEETSCRVSSVYENINLEVRKTCWANSIKHGCVAVQQCQ